MNCEFNLCVYHQDRACTLSGIPDINEIGICDRLEFVTIDPEILQAAKDRIHAEREELYKSWGQ